MNVKADLVLVSCDLKWPFSSFRSFTSEPWETRLSSNPTGIGQELSESHLSVVTTIPSSLPIGSAEASTEHTPGRVSTVGAL